MITVYDYWLAERLMHHQYDTKTVCELFRDSEEAYRESFEDEERFARLKKGTIVKLKDKNLDRAHYVLRECIRMQIFSVKFGDPEYPRLLADIESPPYLLFAKGNLELLNDPFTVTMVGTRSMSTAGKYTAFRTAYELAAKGACIVSGMALGIDGMAHAGALAAKGKTIAVLGCGVNVMYPRAHGVLYSHILKQGGLIISEFFPGETARPNNFPMRNRIMAGLSYSTIVVEATEDSGALITAAEAIKEGRSAYAMPGYSFSAASRGTNKLIESGIPALLSSDTVINEYSRLHKVEVDMRSVPLLTPDFCDRVCRKLQISTKVYDPSSILLRINPDEVLGRKGNEEFPFRIIQEEGPPKKLGSSRQKTEDKDSEEKAGVKGFSEKQSESVREEKHAELPEKQERARTASELLKECEELGIDPDDSIKRVIEKIAEREEFDVDSLAAGDIPTESVLQVVTILSSVGAIEEISPSKFKVCKITE